LILGTLRKILTTGVGAALLTEGSLRNAFSESNLTGQARDYLGRQVSKGKAELTKVLVAELKAFLAKVNMHDEIQKALAGMKLEVQATVTLVPRDNVRGSNKFTVKKLKIRKI
jgi:hypothetical protein